MSGDGSYRRVRVLSANVNVSRGACWNPKGSTIGERTGPNFLGSLGRSLAVAVTSTDVIYISDKDNHRVHYVPLNGSSIGTPIGSTKGSGASQFDEPGNIFVTNTSLYVIDRQNKRLQKMELSGGTPSTALNLTGLGSPGDVHVDSQGNIYLSDTTKHEVLFYAANSSNGTRVAGTGVKGRMPSRLDGPHGVFVSPTYEIYVADCKNHRIMKWLSNFPYGFRVAGSTKQGSALSQLNYPQHVVLDANNRMYISDTGNRRIMRWVHLARSGECIAGCPERSGSWTSELASPRSIALDSKGSLYVADGKNQRVQKFQVIDCSGQYPFL